MSKTRVYELAQKMGIDNKELIAKLKAVGIEVKNHMAVVEDEDIQKLTAAPKAADQSQGEVRVKPTLIRRRAKVVEEAAAAEAVSEVEVAAAEEQPAAAKELVQV